MSHRNNYERTFINEQRSRVKTRAQRSKEFKAARKAEMAAGRNESKEVQCRRWGGVETRKSAVKRAGRQAEKRRRTFAGSSGEWGREEVGGMYVEGTARGSRGSGTEGRNESGTQRGKTRIRKKGCEERRAEKNVEGKAGKVVDRKGGRKFREGIDDQGGEVIGARGE
jgi:hypothetical protein